MKKLSIIAVVFAAVVIASCGGANKSSQNVEADSTKSFEQSQIEANIKMQIDSIAVEFGKIDQPPFFKTTKDGIQLSKEAKLVKPDYLLAANVADEATTLAEKYRVLTALSIDKKVAELYEMPTEDYDKAIGKLAADINDPSFKVIENPGAVFETTSALYEEMEKNGRINYFWQIAAAALVEQLNVISQTQDQFLTPFTDETAANVTYRIILILDAVNRLAQYDPDIEPVAEALAPLNALNATTVAEMSEQMTKMKDKIDAARKALIK